MKTRTRAPFVMFVLILVSTFLLSVVSAHAQQACTNKSAKGTYGYSCTGAVNGQPFAAYGVVTSDGRGQWKGYGKVSLNGTILPWTHSTTPQNPSKVNPDCTGSVTYKVTINGLAQDNDAHFEFVIVDNGREVKGFPVDVGYAAYCQLILEKHGFLELEAW